MTGTYAIASPFVGKTVRRNRRMADIARQREAVVDDRPLKNRRFGFYLEEELQDKLKAYAASKRQEMAEVVRRGIIAEIEGKAVAEEDPDTEQFRAKYLDQVPCGPWDDAVDLAGEIVVDKFVADELEARDEDVWVRASGQSMEGAGIVDGFLVLVRPYDGKRARRGEIVLVQATTESGECLSTLKRYNGDDMRGAPKLLDGNDEDYALPEDTREPKLIARAVGVIGRL